MCRGRLEYGRVSTTTAERRGRGAPAGTELTPPLRLEHVPCCLCGGTDGRPEGVGRDFEYHTSPDTFLALRCPRCDLVYLDPRPVAEELGRIYPDDYHAFTFDAESFGVVHKVRRRLEARRLLRIAGDLRAGSTIVDVGCGDGFHLDLLRDFGSAGWKLVGVDLDERAVERACARGLDARLGTVDTAGIGDDTVDLVLLIQTVEHVAAPPEVLAGIRRVLRPGGRLLVVTDNTDSLDQRLFGRAYWGGYHFPRHWNLFNARSLRALAATTGFEVDHLTTMVSPVNWTYSVRNALDDLGARRSIVDFFSLKSAPSLAAFTAFDSLHQLAGRGALLRAVLRKPAS